MRTFITALMLVFCNSAFTQGGVQIDRIDSLIQPFIQPQSPGFSIGVIENGKLICQKNVGLANIETGDSISGNSIFSIASIAKQFTAACIWSLIQENKISLDDDIRKFIPEFPSYDKKIRIRHMLNHTSGIRNYHAIMELAGFDYDREFHDNQTILDLACKQISLNNTPGEKVIYGNTSYTLLAIIIERITGQNLNEYAKTKIFLPLGMSNTFYRTTTSSTIANRALGYVENKNGIFEHFESNQSSYGAGSVGSSIEDLAIWSNVLNGLNSDYVELTKFLATIEVLKSGEMAKYARGVMVDEYRHMKTIHHSGFSLGGQSQIIAVPEIKLAVVILTNLESIDPSPLSYKILDLFIQSQKKEEPKPSLPFHTSKKELQKFVGQYKEQNSDMKLEIILENDTLKSQGSSGKKAIPLNPVDRWKFTRSNNSGVVYDFASAKKSNADLIIYFGGTPFYFSRAQFIDPEIVELSDYVGRYASVELSVEYEIYIEDDALYVNYPNHNHIKLMVGQKDEFGNGQRILYQFARNREDEVIKLYLSAEGTVRHIEFKKQ